MLDAAEAALGLRFADRSLLAEALSHSGLAQGRRAGPASNERLEFVGDRVLGLVVAEWLIERFPDEREGPLARRLAQLVSEETLAEVAASLGLGALLAVAPGDEKGGVRGRRRALADAAEAVIGAIHLDRGLEAARAFIRRALADLVPERAPMHPKSALQEWAMGRGLEPPRYTVVAASGPDHAPTFRVRASCAGESVEAEGATKQAAEKAAAALLLARVAKDALPG